MKQSVPRKLVEDCMRAVSSDLTAIEKELEDLERLIDNNDAEDR